MQEILVDKSNNCFLYSDHYFVRVSSSGVSTTQLSPCVFDHSIVYHDKKQDVCMKSLLTNPTAFFSTQNTIFSQCVVKRVVYYTI